MKQRQQQQHRLAQPSQPVLSVQAARCESRAQPRIAAAHEATLDNGVRSAAPRVPASLPHGGAGGDSAVDAASLFSHIAGPIRRLWLSSQPRSSHSARKRRRVAGASELDLVDLTSDERLDEWQRAASAIAVRQPSWQWQIAQHCNLSQLSDSDAAPPTVPHLLVRVESLTPSSFSPQPLSARQLHQVAACRAALHAAGVWRERVSGLDDAASSAGGVDSASLLLGYHSACLSDADGVVTADVHDSLCRSAGGSSMGGVLSVGCHVLLRDVAVLHAGDGRQPHLLVQRHNVCAVQQPATLDELDAQPVDTALSEAQAGEHLAHSAHFVPQAAPAVSSVNPTVAAATAPPAGIATVHSMAAVSSSSSDAWDMLDLGED